MIDVNGLLNALQNDKNTQKTAMVGGGAALAGLATGMLAGKSGRKFMGKAAKYGGIAALGGLAYHAVNKMNQNRQAGAQAPAAGTSPTPQSQHAALPQGPDYEAAPAASAYVPAESDTQAFDERAKSLVRAMISAAKADGVISEGERAIIQERMESFNLDGETRTFVELEMVKPLNLDQVTAHVQSVEHAAEIYAASLVAIDDEGPVEKAYLGLLAARLRLDPVLVEDMHQTAKVQAG